MTVSSSEHPVSRPFYGRIEGIRGIGTMIVAGYHFTGCCVNGHVLLQPTVWSDASPAQHFLGRLALGLFPGHAFLMAFFVISGFVLRLSLGNGPQSAGKATARFLIARLFRFFPIVAVAVLVAAVMPVAHASVISNPPIAANLLLLDVSMNPHLWALQVELLMVPVILALFFLERRWSPIMLLIVAATTTGLAFWPRWAVFPPLSTNLFAFVLGMAIPTLGQEFVTRLSARTAIVLVAAMAFIMLTVGQLLGTYSRWTSVVEAYSASVVLCVIVYRTDLACLRWLDSRSLNHVGAASGSYYVLHTATYPFLIGLATLVVPANGWAHWPAVVGLLVIVGWLVAIAPVMMCFAALVERPGIAVGRRVSRALGLESTKPRPAEQSSSSRESSESIIPWERVVAHKRARSIAHRRAA